MREDNMTRKLGIAIALGATLLTGQAYAENNWRPTVLKVNDPDPNDLARVNDDGTLRKTDEEFTNEMGVMSMFADGKRGIYVEMRTGALSTGESPVHNMQGACTPIELAQAPDGTVNFVKLPGERFISDNDGNEYRNFNKPQLMPIANGRGMLVMFNYQPEGTNDTRRYAKVVDKNCNEIPVFNANGEQRKQVLIMAKNNDDCDMHQTGDGPCDIATDEGGSTHLSCWAGCNGNGEDDGWLNDITVDCELNAQGDAVTSCQIRKNFDISLCQREERSRGRCSIASDDPNTAICTWTEGNNQPQRDGTWIAAVDISPTGEMGEDAQSRLLWKEQIDGRKEYQGEETYSVRAKHTRIMVPGPDGTLKKTDMLIFHSGDLDGKNRDNRKGGTYRAQQLLVMRANAQGLEYITPRINANDLLLGIDATHLTMCGAVFGEGNDLMPGFTLLQGSHNGGGVTEPVVKAIGYDMATQTFVDLGTHRTGGSYDRHLYSNYLGNNPGNQGRNFAGCQMIKNPFAGLNGNNTQYFIAHALTGKDPDYVGMSQYKPSSYVTLLPVATVPQIAAPPPPAEEPPVDEEPPPSEEPAPTDPAPVTPEPEPTEPAAKPPSVMGCTASTGTPAAGGALFMLFAIGAAFIVRRKRG